MVAVDDRLEGAHPIRFGVTQDRGTGPRWLRQRLPASPSRPQAPMMAARTVPVFVGRPRERFG